MCRYVYMVCDAPGAAPVLLVLLNRIGSNGVCVTPNLRQGLLTRNTAKSHVPGIL